MYFAGVGHVARMAVFFPSYRIGWVADGGWAVGIKAASSARTGLVGAPVASYHRSRDGGKERATEGTSQCSRVPCNQVHLDTSKSVGKFRAEG